MNPAWTGAPVSAHFVNNVLAAAASYIEDDPEYARDVLAELGQFLAYRLRDEPSPMPASQELAHVATYFRLQQARFPDRIEADLSQASGGSSQRVLPGTLQRAVSEALGRRLSEHSGPCRVVLRAAGEDFELELSAPDGGGAERVAIALNKVEGVLP